MHQLETVFRIAAGFRAARSASRSRCISALLILHSCILTGGVGISGSRTEMVLVRFISNAARRAVGGHIHVHGLPVHAAVPGRFAGIAGVGTVAVAIHKQLLVICSIHIMKSYKNRDRH